MSTVTTYTSFYQVQLDLLLYMAIKNKEPLNLSHIPTLAAGRWPWVVEQWSKIFPSFMNTANGDEILSSSLKDLTKTVESTKLGNHVNAFASPEKIFEYSPFLETILLTSLNLAKSERDLLSAELKRATELDISTFRNMLSFLKESAIIMSQNIGLADELSAQLRGGVLPTPRRSANYNDLLRLDSYIELEKYIEGIIVEEKNKKQRPPNLLTVANNNIATESGFSVKDNYLSFFAVPFQKSLQKMADKYLGSPDRWFEIVTVNHLKLPFIDDKGEKEYLLSTGIGNTVYIKSTFRDRLYTGGKVRIGSSRLREELRAIERVINNKDDTITLFLSGDPDLQKLTVSDRAYVKIYYPNTITTGDFVMIPSPIAPTMAKSATPHSAELRALDPALLNFGVDIQRDEFTEDFILDASGNFKLCAGYNNVRQATRTVLKLEQGDLPYHPELGLPETIGSIYYGSYTEAQIFSDLISQAMRNDWRFSDVLCYGVENAGNSMKLRLDVYIQDSTAVVPMDFVT